MDVGVGGGASTLEVFPTDEAYVNIDVGEGYRAAFLKIKVQILFICFFVVVLVLVFIKAHTHMQMEYTYLSRDGVQVRTFVAFTHIMTHFEIRNKGSVVSISVIVIAIMVIVVAVVVVGIVLNDDGFLFFNLFFFFGCYCYCYPIFCFQGFHCWFLTAFLFFFSGTFTRGSILVLQVCRPLRGHFITLMGICFGYELIISFGERVHVCRRLQRRCCCLVILELLLLLFGNAFVLLDIATTGLCNGRMT